MRFIKKNRIIHLQAQAGKLLPGGLIDQSTVSWIPLPDINVYRSKDGVDYHTLNYYNRKIDLNDVDLADSYVVTGNLKICSITFNMLNYEVLFSKRCGIESFGVSPIFRSTSK